MYIKHGNRLAIQPSHMTVASKNQVQQKLGKLTSAICTKELTAMNALSLFVINNGIITPSNYLASATIATMQCSQLHRVTSSSTGSQS